MQFRRTQSPFTLTVRPVTIASAEDDGLEGFINCTTVREASRAIPGRCTYTTVPKWRILNAGNTYTTLRHMYNNTHWLHVNLISKVYSNCSHFSHLTRQQNKRIVSVAILNGNIPLCITMYNVHVCNFLTGADFTYVEPQHCLFADYHHIVCCMYDLDIKFVFSHRQ